MIVVNKNFVEVLSLYVLQAFVSPQLRECGLGFVIFNRSYGSIVTAVDIREKIESPEELEKCVGLIGPIERLGIYHAGAVAAKESTSVTKKDDSKGEHAKLRTMECRRVSEQLPTNLVCGIGPTYVSFQVTVLCLLFSL